ncbi:hypothetical protein A5640_09080 [Mycobacterium asiaticum]|uniref:MmgE/PrpD N-terminal domain-containing protein n=1 Tax=Mycobacterium asiaticum TaxID=1790 RepID=A0A1A3KSD8_MYCAS|nr:hypothetical protein A5640_09080 [Mycobacterium asiaticum]
MVPYRAFGPSSKDPGRDDRHMLQLDTETIYQAIGQALHLTTATRQSRKGYISSWKAFAPAWAGKVGIEAVDRAMRGEGAPAPIWEGEDGVIAWLLSGPEQVYRVPLPEPGEPKRAILDSYTKEHSAEYQSQALIDLARRLRDRIGDPDQVGTAGARLLGDGHQGGNVVPRVGVLRRQKRVVEIKLPYRNAVGPGSPFRRIVTLHAKHLRSVHRDGVRQRLSARSGHRATDRRGR